MIRTFVARKLGYLRGGKLSAHFGKPLLWPLWCSISIDSNRVNSTSNEIKQLIRWHRRIGTRIFVLEGPELVDHPDLIQVVRECWFQGGQPLLAFDNHVGNPDQVIDVIREGVQAITLSITDSRSPSVLDSIVAICTLQSVYPDIPIQIVVRSCSVLTEPSIDALLKATEKGVKLILDTRDTLPSKLDRLDWEQHSFADFEFTRDWGLLIERGCSCIQPYSGWFIDVNRNVRLCRDGLPVGQLIDRSAKSVWLDPSARESWKIPCLQSSTEQPSFYWVYQQPVQVVPCTSHAYDIANLPRISVVVPTYRRPATTIKRTLDALMAQSYPHDAFEIMLIDDGSPKNEAEEAVRQLGWPPNVHYFKTSHGGAASARNQGIQLSHGEIVAFTDDDCAPESNWLQEIAAVFLRHPIGGTGGLTLPTVNENAIVRFIDHRRALRRFLVDTDAEQIGVIPTANAAYRRQALERVGGFSEEFKKAGLSYGGEDRDLTWKIIQANYEIRLNLKAVVWHEHRSTFMQLLRQAYHYGKGCYLHCYTAGLPLDYEPRVETFIRLAKEYLLPYQMRVARYYRDGASLSDAYLFPLVDFARRCSSALGACAAASTLKDMRSRGWTVTSNGWRQ